MGEQNGVLSRFQAASALAATLKAVSRLQNSKIGHLLHKTEPTISLVNGDILSLPSTNRRKA